MAAIRAVVLVFFPVVCMASESFVRGDVNQDGFVGIADLVMLAGTIAREADAAFPFPDAADIDDDGAVDAEDVTAFVDRFFLASRPVIPSPFPTLGRDPTPDALPGPSISWQRPVHGGPGGVAGMNRFSDPGGGSDLQYIRFMRSAVLVEPGSTLRIPILLRTMRSLGGVTFALSYDSAFFSHVALDFRDTAPVAAGGETWEQHSLAAQGRLAAACLFRHEQQRGAGAWSNLTLAYLELQVAAGTEPGVRTEIGFEELPFPGLASAVWIYNEVSDDQGIAHDLRERSQSLTITASSGPAFVRGEIDRSGAIDVGDALFLLDYLFGTGSPPRCPDAADVNDDGFVAISDAVAILSYLWKGEALPKAPFPAAGLDSTPDDLGRCEAQPLGLGAP